MRVHNNVRQLGGEILSEAIPRFDPLWVTYRLLDAEPDVGVSAGVELVTARHGGRNVLGYLTDAELDLIAQEAADDAFADAA